MFIQKITIKKERNSRYLGIYILWLTTFFLLVGVTNYIVNPHRLFNNQNLFQLKEKKPFENWLNHSRYHKANQIATGDYDTLILGNSRVFGGLNPKHPSFADDAVYNAGLPGANIYEIEKIFNYAKSQTKFKKVIIGLDLGQFYSERYIYGDFNKSRFAGKLPYFRTYYSNLLSVYYFLDSLEKIKSNVQNEPVQSNRFIIIDGFKKTQKNYLRNPQKQFIDYAKKFTGKKLYLGFNYSKERLKILQKIIDECREEKIEIQLFISPVHAWQLEFMDVSGIFHLFEDWKKDLVNLIAIDAKKNPNESAIFLWDFSSYNVITTEVIPSDSKAQMQWFWDPSHYKEEVGNIILDIINKSDRANYKQIKGFGKLINQNNIENHLQQIRQQQKNYQRNHRTDIKIIQEIAKENKRDLIGD